jgi:hypothetical protein
MDENKSVVAEFSCSACNYFYSCRNWKGVEVFGECRYNPPIVDGVMPGVFPRVEPEDWCGKWKARGWLRQLERGEL